MRDDDPEPGLIAALAARIFRPAAPPGVERVPHGVSTHVYRLRHGAEVFYLRVLPEEGASFAPEVRVHRLLRERGVRVPAVIYFAQRDEMLGRSVMVTTAIAGRPLSDARAGVDLRDVLRDAGRDLARLNVVPVAGFG